jgi:hypothetical protein
MPGMRSRRAKVEKRPVQPLSTAEEARASNRRTLSAAAAPEITTGSRSATAYQRNPTRQRTIRRSSPTTPILPWTTASTTSAARKGPKPIMVPGTRPAA